MARANSPNRNLILIFTNIPSGPNTNEYKKKIDTKITNPLECGKTDISLSLRVIS